MFVSTGIPEVRAFLSEQRDQGKRIGVVPTMGALHEGHMSLVRVIQPHCDYVVLWLFLNPTQFNCLSDYERYPRTLARDTELAAEAGVDLVFAPSVEDVYPAGLDAYAEQRSVRVYAGDRSRGYCGGKRPGHFDGVAHVVAALFNILQPDVAVFGEKDYQQLQVIRQMVADLHFNVEIIAAPLIRDKSGLALSSRNELLSACREGPLSISRALQMAKQLVNAGERRAARVQELVRREVEGAGLRLDYVEVADAETLEVLERIENRAQLLIAAYAGDVRLIDNIRLECAGE
jgi:pantoate--beta-alanine ligase